MMHRTKVLFFAILIECFLSKFVSSKNIAVFSVSKDRRFYSSVFNHKYETNKSIISIRKCCPFLEDIRNRRCQKMKESPISLFLSDVNYVDLPFYVEIGNQCSKAKSSRIMIDVMDNEYLIDSFTGNLMHTSHEHSWSKNDYCVDFIGGILRALVCHERKDKYFGSHITIGMIISMPFLLITFIVYALLPDRNLHMKALMCYVINLFFAYMFLVTIQLTDDVIEDTFCGILGFGCVFFFLASFFWMNVICIDIFLGFRGFRGVPGARSSERRRFLWYCLYAWGMSFLIVLITFIINKVGTVGRWYHPGVAFGKCFIRDGTPQLLYFYGPMGTIIILNVLLFSLTAMKIRQVKRDTAMLKHSESKRHSDDDQQNFYLYMKLLLAMGVNWSMELISWAVNTGNNVPQYVWYLTDFCNATYGVFIFFIFVFKRNIWKQLKRRYYNFTGRHHLAHSMATTNQTRTTNDSMTVSTNDRAMEESELNVTKIN